MITKQNCVLLSFQSFLCAKHFFFFNEGYFYSSSFQGIVKDIPQFFNFQRLFKDMMLFQWLFQGLCEPCWGYITSPRQVRNKQVCCHLTDLIAEAIPRFVWIVDPVRHGSSSYCSFLLSDLSWRYCCHLLCGALTSATRKKKKRSEMCGLSKR